MGSGRIHVGVTGVVRRCDAKTRNALERDVHKGHERETALILISS